MRMNKKKIVISVGYVLAMALAVSAFFAALAVDDFGISIFSLSAMILINIVYSFLNIKRCYIFLIFNVSFFVLLLGRYMLRTIQGIEWWGVLGADIEKETLLVVASALIVTSALAFILSNIFSDRKIVFDKYAEPENEKIIRLFSFWFLIFVLLFSYAVVVEQVIFVQGNSYLELYTSTFNELPAIFYKIHAFLPVAVSMFMVSMPSKWYRRFGLILYFAYLILTLFTGVRGDFVIGVIAIMIFIVVYHFKRPLERVITAPRVATVFIAGVLTLSFLGAYNTLRNDVDTGKDFWGNITQFIDDQGTSINVIENTVKYKDTLPKTNSSYFFGSLLNRFRYGALSGIGDGRDDLPDCADRINNALFCNNLGATISYYVLGDAYLAGYGLGTQYLAELFADFDYVGVIVYSCLLGVALILLACALLSNDWALGSLSFVAVMNIIYIPRQSAINWMLVPFSLTYILPIALVWFASWIIPRRRIRRRKSSLRNKEGSQVKKILWTTNVIMPYPAKQIGRKPSVFGGWLVGLMKQIVNSKSYKLAIAAVYGGNKLKRFDDGKVIYYLLPCKNDTKYNGDLEFYWREVVADFQPDLIHLHGTEFMHNLALQNACPNEKYLVSLQGLMGPISKKYLAGISKKEYRKNMTPRDFLQGSVLKEQKNFCRRAEYEKMILKNANAIVGRTEWDRVNSLKIAGNKPYYKCNEILRDAFYNQDWNIRQIEPHSIYISQASYPLKGFHILLEALPKLVEKYPDLKVFVAGTDILDRSTLKKKLLYSGYAKILDKKIKRHHLKDNIEFIGEKSENGVLEYMKKSNVFVQCSVIENSSNSLGEAMLIGMPCVASDVGGTADLLDVTKGEGLLYRFGDAKTLAELIGRVFDDFGLAIELGENAKKHAKIIYDRQENADTMLEIYKKVINS